MSDYEKREIVYYAVGDNKSYVGVSKHEIPRSDSTTAHSDQDFTVNQCILQ